MPLRKNSLDPPVDLCKHIWRKTHLYCEDCGDHEGFICDRCLVTVDWIFDAAEFTEIEDTGTLVVST